MSQSEPIAATNPGRAAGKRALIAVGITAAATALLIFALGSAAYDWIKAVHVIAVMSWMAGMLYLPRLFIYHCDAAAGTQQSETFKIMEARLFNFIMTPALIVSWVLGLWLAWDAGWFSSGWFHAKLLTVIAMTGVHGHFAQAVRAFGQDQNLRSTKYWRIMNEVPTLLMIAAVILVIVKPF